MKKAVNVFVVIAFISFIVAIISRLTMTPLPVVRGGLEAGALLNFTNTCLLIAITLMLMSKCKKD